MQDKLLIIINGVGGVGKDTIVDIVAKHYVVRNVSSVEPFKQLLIAFGIEPKQQKTPKGRRLLSDLKKAFDEYNNMSTAYLTRELIDFVKQDQEIMFAHIREPEYIAMFKEIAEHFVPVVTLLITGRNDGKVYGNMADDGVMDYHYDAIFKNDVELKELERRFMEFFKEILGDET